MGEKLLGKVVLPTQFWLHYLSENNSISEDYLGKDSKIQTYYKFWLPSDITSYCFIELPLGI